MFTTDVLTGKKVTLKMCGTEYATEEYVNWLNDPQVNRFLWVRYERQTLEKITDYINEIRESEDKIIFAMIESSQNKHIGSIQLTFNKIHKYCNFGYFIGDKNFWGQEIAVEAIHLAIKWAFETTDTVRMNGSLYSRNVFSLKTLLKAGFHKEAVLKDYLTWKDDARDDMVLMYLFREEFEKTGLLEH